MTDYTPNSLNQRHVLLIALGAVVLVVATAVVTTWLITRPASAPAAAAPPPSRTPTSVHGDLILERGEFSWQSPTDLTCWGISGYEDLKGGAEVTVTDAAGKVVAVGALGTGVAFVGSDGLGERCLLEFVIAGVPSGVGPYGIEVTHRGPAHFSEDDLNKVELSFH